jgi:phenylalanyl-tRNA synthetase beta chain
MKISKHWLDTFFDTPLPDVEVLAEALTFHAFEIDGIESVGDDRVLDVKVTPNRGHDCLCHLGIARELAAILKLEMSASTAVFNSVLPNALGGVVSVRVDTPLCSRYIAAYIKGVKVSQSPEWLKNRLEAIGQRSINNVVDATNYVMFHLGQPLHAFDAGKLLEKNGAFSVSVRAANLGEKMLALDEKEYTLAPNNLVIADEHKGEAIGIAGVKGGMPAGITENTTDIILESANFDGVSVRKTAQSLKLRTDASSRFEQVISPELAGYGMNAVIKLILECASGEVVGMTDVYPKPQEKKEVSVTTNRVVQVLGNTFGEKEIKDAFDRLRFAYKQEGEVFTVEVPPERLDLTIPEDLVEEVGRIIGYDHVPATPLPSSTNPVEVNQNFAASEQARERLVVDGYSEVFTSVFADVGERVVLNKVDGVRPYLRDSLVPGLADALKKNSLNKDRLGLKEVKLFEIGTVWRGGKEVTMLGTISEKAPAQEEPLTSGGVMAYEKLPLSTVQKYQPFSRFPYIVRDVALWASSEVKEENVEKIIGEAAGALCAKISLFDRFEKEGRVSFGFRLIFQSFDRTLTDGEVNVIMEKVYSVLTVQGFTIR